MSETVYTFCRICLASCGLEVTVDDNRVTKIAADKQNPHSWRDFCAKGRTAHRLIEHPRRILQPMRRVGDSYVEATWDEAIADIAARMNAAIEAGGPDAVGVYYGNPAGFSSSNVIFMNGWLDALGTQNRYAVGSVDQNAMHVVADAMYGSILMVPVSDVDNCDYFLLVGTNPAVSAWNWLESVPGGWRRAMARQQQGATIVVVDPLRTESAEKADLHLAVRPGQDWALLLAMVKVILDERLEHRQDCAELATGVDDLRALVADADLDDLAARCDVPRDQIERVARDFAAARGAMVVTRTGVSLHMAGTVAEWLGHVLNVITGRMDRPGGRRFEPGYVDAIRMSAMVRAKPHYSRLLGREMVAGAHALSELPDEITTPGHGQIRALLINCGNPVVSGPDGDKLDRALADLDLLVAIDFVQRESHRHAHWLLPAAHWLERNDLLAFTSNMHDEPYLQYGAKAVEPPPGVRQEWRIFTDLAIAMRRPLFRAKGLNGFIKATRAAARMARKPALEFGPHWIDRLVVATSRKVNGRKIKWRDVISHPHGWVLGPREFGHFRDALRTDDKKVHAAPPEFVARARELLADPLPAAPVGYPFQLANRRHRHSMNSWLNELPGLHPAGKGNDVIIHPKDAADLGVSDGDLVRVFSPVGAVELTAVVDDRPREGVVIIDHGWGSRVFDPRGASNPISYGVNRNLLVEGAPVDPLSQTSALSSQYVGVELISSGDDQAARHEPR
ncbi:formate dehydrogenase [Mycolicibacterium novocastrense]|uniref:molybdopterin-containing oxidoreductase family protein n=1 Tax=Mycolicibacterium novocastrense TaxID=59813 RepID=UPI000749C0EE|nr:molybdopterin-dependent oxidoreductase [Mycolicibacterium novocastrense]KUH73804.1 formate dehydrogenase [Mycolicibacterium novocastrense]KUH74627.1 formate dehydrogenase [Mycolicibacterium novocastrense]KUH75677.1 formate dehydrogenase [Mycolicibacterium novocastrense]